MLAWKAWTMSSASHRVPEPLRSTWKQRQTLTMRTALNPDGLQPFFTLMTDLVGLHGDDGAQGEDEGVNVLHVEVIRGHGV